MLRVIGLAILAFFVVVGGIGLTLDSRRRLRRSRKLFLLRCADLQSRADGINNYLATRGQHAFVDVTTNPPRLVVSQLGEHDDEDT